MIYEHPLAYVLGLEGIALMRAYTGEHDRAFVEARLAEIREFLDDDSLTDAAVEVTRVDTLDGYRIWSQTYDGPNAAFDADEPFIRKLVDALPAGDALERPGERTDVLGPWDVWPWALCDLAPEAARAAIAGTPSMLFWHFQR